MGLHKIGGGGMHIDIANVFAKATRTVINVHGSKVALCEIETYIIMASITMLEACTL
jgi:hypothetical protein